MQLVSTFCYLLNITILRDAIIQEIWKAFYQGAQKENNEI